MSRKKIVRKNEKMLTEQEKTELLDWVLTDPKKEEEKILALPAPVEPESKEKMMAKMVNFLSSREGGSWTFWVCYKTFDCCSSNVVWEAEGG